MFALMGDYLVSTRNLIGVNMKSILSLVSAVVGILLATSGSAFADGELNVPEPGSIALVGVAVAALVAFSRRKK